MLHLPTRDWVIHHAWLQWVSVSPLLLLLLLLPNSVAVTNVCLFLCSPLSGWTCRPHHYHHRPFLQGQGAPHEHVPPRSAALPSSSSSSSSSLLLLLLSILFILLFFLHHDTLPPIRAGAFTFIESYTVGLICAIYSKHGYNETGLHLHTSTTCS